MTFDECKRKGLIRPNPKAKNRVKKELQTAQHFLTSATRVIKIKECDLTIISAYNSCFHFARALLFQNKHVEKSHYCLIEAMK
jgi:uncharacterized protein (UPF0332 family)